MCLELCVYREMLNKILDDNIVLQPNRWSYVCWFVWNDATTSEFFFSVNDIIVRNRSKRVYDHRFCENSPDVNTFASLLIYCITTVRFVWVFVSPLHFLWTHFLMSCENAFEFPLKYLPFANLCKNMVSFAVALTVYWKHESHCCMTHDCTRSS